MKCKICDNSTSHIFDANNILNKYSTKYFQCSVCDFIQVESPYWLKEAYCDAIAKTDVGILHRNIADSAVLELIISRCFDPKKNFIDYGGGYGILVRLMRDKGFSFFRQDAFCQNLFAQGFDYEDADVRKFEVLTAFEVFEHLADPLQEIKKMLEFSESIIFSTLLIPAMAMKNNHDWWYFSPETGQHISFYSKKTLSKIATHFNCDIITDGRSLHMLTKTKIRKNVFNGIAFRTHKTFVKLSGLGQRLLSGNRNSSLVDQDCHQVRSSIKRSVSMEEAN